VKALTETLTLELPNLVQMDVSLLSGLLAKEILKNYAGQFRQNVFLQFRHGSGGSGD
jgi:hypothetical protein